jgi:hypothetical protein
MRRSFASFASAAGVSRAGSMLISMMPSPARCAGVRARSTALPLSTINGQM